MDIPKLEGFIEAIEAESKQPNPSHSNLARLVAMFFREWIKMLQVPEDPRPHVCEPEKQVEATPDQAPEAEPEEEKHPVKHLKKQKSKKG